MSLKQLVILILTFLAVIFANANTAKLERLLSTYRKSSGVTMNVNKTVKSELLEKETSFKGNLTLSKGKMFWDTETPDKNLLIFDGTYLWSVQYPPKEFEAPPQIAKTKLAGSAKNKNVLIILLNGKSVKDKFDIKLEASDKELVFNLKEKKSDLNIKNIKLILDAKGEELVRLSYEDEVNNKTDILFSTIKLNQKIQSSLFEYKPPKGATVSEY